MSISLSKIVENTGNIKSIRVIAPVDFSIIWYQKFIDVYKNENNIGTKFIIDLVNTTFLSTSALRMILLLKDHVDFIEGELTFVNPNNEQPFELLQTSTFDLIFDISFDEGCYRNYKETMPLHGSYSISSNNQILTVKAYDEWNTETVTSCCEAFKAEAKKLMHENWSCLVDLSEWELGPPGMLREINKLNVWSEENKQVFEAVVVKNSVQQHFLENSHKVFNTIESKFFDNHDDALSWLSNSQKIT